MAAKSAAQQLSASLADGAIQQEECGQLSMLLPDTLYLSVSVLQSDGTLTSTSNLFAEGAITKHNWNADDTVAGIAVQAKGLAAPAMHADLDTAWRICGCSALLSVAIPGPGSAQDTPVGAISIGVDSRTNLDKQLLDNVYELANGLSSSLPLDLLPGLAPARSAKRGIAAAAAAAIASVDEESESAVEVPHTGSLEAQALGLSDSVFLKRQTSHKVGEGPPPRPAIIAFKVQQGDKAQGNGLDIVGWVDCRENGESFVVLGSSDRSKHVPTVSDADEVKKHYQGSEQEAGQNMRKSASIEWIEFPEVENKGLPGTEAGAMEEMLDEWSAQVQQESGAVAAQ